MVAEEQKEPVIYYKVSKDKDGLKIISTELNKALEVVTDPTSGVCKIKYQNKDGPENITHSADFTLDTKGGTFGLLYRTLSENGKPLNQVSMSFPIKGEPFSLESRTYGEAKLEPTPVRTKSRKPREKKLPPKYDRSIKYASKLQSLIGPDGFIRENKINETFKDGKTRVGAKQALIWATKRPDKPVERVGNDYRILDKEYFSNLAQQETALQSGKPIIISDYAQKHLNTMKTAGLLSPTKDTVTFREIKGAFPTRGGMIGVMRSIAHLTRTGIVKEQGKDNDRKYHFPQSIINTETTPNETTTGTEK